MGIRNMETEKFDNWFMCLSGKNKKSLLKWGLTKPKLGKQYALEVVKIDKKKNKVYLNFVEN